MTSNISLSILEPTTCEGCGVCCLGIGSPVMVYATGRNRAGHVVARPEGLPEELLREVEDAFAGLFRGQEPQDKCLWYDVETKRCKHYEWRPEACREYEMAGPACLEQRRVVIFEKA